MTAAASDRARAQHFSDSVEFWWHSIDLGHGVVTPGFRTPESLAHDLGALRLPDLAGKSVLDVGAYDGFYSFEAEKRGARRVVALDHYVWSLDLPGHIAYWRECKERGVTPLPNEQTPHWQPEKLPGRKGFDAAHQALASKVEPVVGDFMTMDVSGLGRFDVVLYLGVLYHMENPLASLRRLAAVTGELAIIETHAVAIPGFDDLELCEFYSANQLNADVTNWWGPNLTALVGLSRAAGFSRVDIVAGDPVTATGAGLARRVRTALGDVLRAASVLPGRPGGGRRHFRAVVHAWK